MAQLSVRDVRKDFGSRTVLRDVTFDVGEKEFLAVVGPSGCGKSTLLRIIAGLERATHGNVLLDGRPVDGWSPYARNVGMVFQNYALYPHMTVRDNLSFGLLAHRVDRAEVRRRVEEVADLLGIRGHLDVRPQALSGGQRQRVALGRALVRRPQLFLMDEPLSNLDAVMRERMRVDLRALHERAGIPTVYVTHDQTEAMTMADRIAVMHEGAVAQLGTPEEVYERPASTLVARFFGSPPMNLVQVDVAHDGGWTVRAVGGDARPVAPPAQSVAAMAAARGEDGRAWIGFRAEHVVTGTAECGGLTFAFTVEAVETLGARCHVHGKWAGQPVSVVAESRAGWQRWAAVPAMVPWDQVHWFHGTTGLRVDASPEPLRAASGGSR